MIFGSRKKNRGASIIEYVVLIVMFLAAILMMQKYIFRGLSGRWKEAGDTFSYGEQYQPGDPNNSQTTVDCQRFAMYNGQAWTERWYRAECYECCLYTNTTPCLFWTAPNSVSVCRAFVNEDLKIQCCKAGCEHPSCNF